MEPAARFAASPLNCPSLIAGPSPPRRCCGCCRAVWASQRIINGLSCITKKRRGRKKKSERGRGVKKKKKKKRRRETGESVFSLCLRACAFASESAKFRFEEEKGREEKRRALPSLCGVSEQAIGSVPTVQDEDYFTKVRSCRRPAAACLSLSLLKCASFVDFANPQI